MAEIYEIEDKIIKGNDAKHLLDNKILKEAFQIVKDNLDEKSLSIKTTDVKDCQDVIRSRQILTAIERAIYTFIEDGQFSKKELELISREKTSIFNRGH